MPYNFMKYSYTITWLIRTTKLRLRCTPSTITYGLLPFYCICIMHVRCDGTSIIFDRVSTLLAVVWVAYHLCWQHLLLQLEIVPF
jgi:bacteriorhodopsin